MMQEDLKDMLQDERCGLYILVGMDGGSGRGAVLTVHATAGALSAENRQFIETSVSAHDAGIAVRFRLHAPGDLHAPDSLERFAGLFAHDRIVADPTGAFARVSTLVSLARLIRADFGDAVRSILWRPNASALVVVTYAAAAAKRGTLEADIRSLIDRPDCADLKKTIRAFSVELAMPAGRFTPVDALSRPAPRARPRFAGVLARVSGLAALIGLGTVAVAQAAVPPADLEEDALMPGINALVDLTTLGENAYGGRNRFQAIGGLRLYFGGTATLVASAGNDFGDVNFGRPQGNNFADVPEGSLDLLDKVVPAVPMPIRVAYGC